MIEDEPNLPTWPQLAAIVGRMIVANGTVIAIGCVSALIVAGGAYLVLPRAEARAENIVNLLAVAAVVIVAIGPGLLDAYRFRRRAVADRARWNSPQARDARAVAIATRKSEEEEARVACQVEVVRELDDCALAVETAIASAATAPERFKEAHALPTLLAKHLKEDADIWRAYECLRFDPPLYEVTADEALPGEPEPEYFEVRPGVDAASNAASRLSRLQRYRDHRRWCERVAADLPARLVALERRRANAQESLDRMRSGATD